MYPLYDRSLLCTRSPSIPLLPCSPTSRPKCPKCPQDVLGLHDLGKLTIQAGQADGMDRLGVEASPGKRGRGVAHDHDAVHALPVAVGAALAAQHLQVGGEAHRRADAVVGGQAEDYQLPHARGPQARLQVRAHKGAVVVLDEHCFVGPRCSAGVGGHGRRRRAGDAVGWVQRRRRG